MSTGYLCRQLRKRFKKCVQCTECFSETSDTTSSLTKLVDLKSRGGLIHSNVKLFQLIRYVESCFAENCSSSNVLDLTVDQVLDSYDFSFPCEQHASEVLSYAIFYYVRMRMRQYCFQENQNQIKTFSAKKKLAKFSKR